MYFKVTLLLIFTYLLQVEAFDTTLDTHKESRRWKFHGNFTYANSTLNEEIKKHLRPRLTSPAEPSTGEFERDGIWLIKNDPNSSNVWNMSYSLSHLLFAQAWVTFIAHPSVAVIFRSSNNEEIGRFWSDGKGWCDAVFNVGLRNSFVVETSVPKQGEYVLIDKVVLGIMGNITGLKNKVIDRPCLTTPWTMDNTPPDMEEKQDTNEIKRRILDETPPDMAFKPAKMNATKVSTPNPTSNKQPIGALTRTYQTERGGAKCDCVCTCVKPSSTNMTSSFSTTTPRF